MNILTFDIEEWALYKNKGTGTDEKYKEYDLFLSRILETLDTKAIKATFFCTGMMAEEFPEVIKLIESHGHEIGCHSHQHTWMNKLSESQAKEDTKRAVNAIEQCIGKKVTCYRAPAFSIGGSNKWMFEILAENGITHDSSIFPAVRDFGGFPSFTAKEPCTIEYAGVQIKEIPISMTSICGKQVAYSGGGYFRFFPLGFVKSQMTKSLYTMCYFHINDLLPESMGILSKNEYESYFKEPGTLKNRCVRYIKSNLGKKGAWDKLEKLILSTDFWSLGAADAVIDWEQAPVVHI